MASCCAFPCRTDGGLAIKIKVQHCVSTAGPGDHFYDLASESRAGLKTTTPHVTARQNP